MRNGTLGMLAAAALASSPALAQSGGTCDRRCLLGFLTEYTEALTDNNVARLALAPTVRITSNGEPADLGQGQVWGPGRRLSYRQTFVDPVTGAAVFYGVVTNVVRSARAGAQADDDGAPEH